MVKVLVTGAGGLLGRYLLYAANNHLRDEKFQAFGTRYTSVYGDYRMDITDTQQIAYVMSRVKPQIVIHCAGQADVDYCQSNWQSAQQVNVGGTQNMIYACKRFGAKLVFISTNAVFNGNHPPYKEDDDVFPINRYGHMKVIAERMIGTTMDGKDWLIIRPIMLYGWNNRTERKNWATIAYDMLSAGKTLRMVDDVNTQPTYAYECANVIWMLLKHEQCGIWHVGGMDRMTLYQFTQTVASVMLGMEDTSDVILPVDSSYYPQIAPRPPDTTYDLAKLWDWSDSLHGDDKRYARPSGVHAGLEHMKEVRKL